jgi:hypothetical protein
MRRFFLVLFAVTLLVPALVSAQDQRWLPGMICEGYRLDTNGRGISVLNPADTKPWPEVLKGLGQSIVNAKAGSIKSATKPAQANQVSSIAISKPAPANPVSSEVVKVVPIKQVAIKASARKCPNGWIPTFGECSRDFYDSSDGDKPPYWHRKDLGDAKGIKLSHGVREGYGITIKGALIKDE